MTILETEGASALWSAFELQVFRYRGWPKHNNIFVLYSQHGRGCFCVMPYSLTRNAESLGARFEREGRHVHSDGTLSQTELDFVNRPDLRCCDIPIVVRALARSEGGVWLEPYLQAEVFVASEPSGLGTIRDIIARDALLH
jgi:hypothetical protein